MHVGEIDHIYNNIYYIWTGSAIRTVFESLDHFQMRGAKLVTKHQAHHDRLMNGEKRKINRFAIQAKD